MNGLVVMDLLDRENENDSSPYTLALMLRLSVTTCDLLKFSLNVSLSSFRLYLRSDSTRSRHRSHVHFLDTRSQGSIQVCFYNSHLVIFSKIEFKLYTLTSLPSTNTCSIKLFELFPRKHTFTSPAK